MEAGIDRVRERGLWVVLALVLLIRLPFLNQAIQGDEDTYLKEASHALIDPLHPANTTYVFRGEAVDLRGHSHPPLNAWILAALIALVGSVREIPFHAAYVVFSLIAASAMWSLARRFSPQPLWAVLLFLAVPAFVVNGNSLETDLPFLAFWMAAVALFCAGRLTPAAIAMALATMTAYQAILLTPILGIYCWIHHRRDRNAWLVLATPFVVIAVWQVFERLTTGAMPAAVLGGYFAKYGFQALDAKLRNALMLSIHSCFIVFPPLFVLIWRKRQEPFLLAWAGIFFCGALVLFFAGSARYLLPMAAPVVLMASRLPVRWLATGFTAQMILSVGLAVVNYQHWDAYRRFVPGQPHMWVNGEWGLRHYLEQDGALPLTKTQQIRAGDFIVTSDLGRAMEVTSPTVLVSELVIRPAIPLRLIGLESHSGYSSVSAGFWPFGISRGVIDRVRLAKAIERNITLEYLPMNAPEAADQIISGIYSLEDNRSRWMSRSAVIALKRPAGPMPLNVNFYISPDSRARRVRLLLDGSEVAAQSFSAPGAYTLKSAPVIGSVAGVEVDQTFTAPGDARELGVVLLGVGFQ
jgi:hypothetical protein